MNTAINFEMTNSEDIPGETFDYCVAGETFDYCVADTLIKTGSGLLAGGALSLVLFKRKKWPIVFGLGAGFGMGLANCQHAFRDPHLQKMLHYKLKKAEIKSAAKQS